MAALPPLSVVIPTLNRPPAILDLVHDLQRQEYPNFEIVVVDASATENMELHQAANTDRRITILNVANRGTCFSRNSGVAKAAHDIIVFTDDDVRIPNTKFLAAHAQHYADPTVGGVGGRVLDVNQQLNREQRGPVCTVTKTGRIYPNATSLQRQDINAPRGGNMSFRKSVILQVDGFDERFRGNAMREETDFSLRAVKAGWRIVYEPAADLMHLALSGGSRTADRLTWYRDFFFNESYFFLKNFPRRYLPFLFFRKVRALAACWLYYGHGWPAWWLAPWKSLAEARRLVKRLS